MEYESCVKHQPDSNSGLFLQEVAPTLGFHASRSMTCSRAHARARGQAFRDLRAIIFQAFFQFSLSLSFSHSAELVTSSHLLPVRGALASFLLSPRAWLRISGRAAVPVILISARDLSLSSISILSSLPILLLFRLSLRCTSLSSAVESIPIRQAR